MSRHLSPLAILITCAFVGCQNPLRSSEVYSDFSGGLEQPDSLIDFPEAVAKYPEQPSEPTTTTPVRTADARAIDTGSSAVLASGDLPESQSQRRIVQSMLNEAGDLLADAIEANGNVRDEKLVSAMLAYKDVLREEPTNATAHHRLGVIGDMQGEFIEAEEHYRAALAVTPHNADLISDIGYSYQLQERPEVAEKFLQRALDLEPGHVRAANNLGRLKAERGEYDAAYALFERAGSKSHADSAIAHFFPNGKPDTSPSKAIETNQQVADAREQMAIAREELRKQFEPPEEPAINEPQTLAEDVRESAELFAEFPSGPLPTETPAVSTTPAAMPQVKPADGGVVNPPWRSFSFADTISLDDGQPEPPVVATPIPQPAPTPRIVARPAEPPLHNTKPVEDSIFTQDNSGLYATQPVINETPISLPPVKPASVNPASHPFAGVVNEPIKKPASQIKPVTYERIPPQDETPRTWPGLKQIEPDQSRPTKETTSGSNPVPKSTPVVTPKRPPVELPVITPRAKK